MLTVADILSDARIVFGNCDLPKIYERINDAIEVLSAKGDWDPALLYLDVAVSGRAIVFPTLVQTPLAINFNGVPSLPSDRLFEFHVNGPGSSWDGGEVSWRDAGLRTTMVDLPSPAVGLAIVADETEDVGTEVWVYGADASGVTLRTETSPGVFATGLRLTAQASAATYSTIAPARIDSVSKPVTEGRLRLYASGGTLLAEYQYNETNPRFRRILVNRDATVARVYFRRRLEKVSDTRDLIPLPNRYALKLMLQSLKAYDDEELEKALGYEAQATRMTQESNARIHPPASFPIQIDVRGGISSAVDGEGLDPM